jgi:uncharacterized damage-inducible protein DinB
MQAEMKQMRIVDPILIEMDQEAEITRRLFNVLPEDKMSFRPHPKAKSLGELAMHIATLQGGVAELAQASVTAPPSFPPEVEPTSRKAVLDAFEIGHAKAKAILESTSDADALAEWSMSINGKVVVAMPRAAFWRSILLNHNYHHRGQLSAYLRELDVPLPSIYGPSADTNPFA